MKSLKCRDLTGLDCDYVAVADTKEEAKKELMRHSARHHKEDFQNMSKQLRKKVVEGADRLLEDDIREGEGKKVKE